MSLEWGGGSATKEREELRRVCALLSKEHKVPIVLDNETESAAHYNTADKSVHVGIKNMWIYGADYYVGLILHELGHRRHTPAAPIPGEIKNEYNMLEDERVNEKIRDEYAGGEWYLSETERGALKELERVMHSLPKTFNAFGGEKTVAELCNPREPKNAATIQKELYTRTLAKAILETREVNTRGMSIGNDECENISAEIVRYLRKAQTARADEIPKLATQARALLSKIYTPPGNDGGEQLVKRLVKKQGGHGDSKSYGRSEPDHMYLERDSAALQRVGELKRRLLRRLRDNEHTKLEPNKRRGLLVKRTLSRIARNNYRIYGKRILPKRKRYTASVLLDTSGSMFHWGKKRILAGLYSAALVVRALRGLGVPTSLTLYGASAYTVLDHRDRYQPDTIQEKIDQLPSDVYESGANETHEGLKIILPRLRAVGGAGGKLVIVITDGGLTPPDIKKSKTMIEKARRHGTETRILYLEDYSERRILQDPERERYIPTTNDLPQACADLVRGVAYAEQ